MQLCLFHWKDCPQITDLSQIPQWGPGGAGGGTYVIPPSPPPTTLRVHLCNYLMDVLGNNVYKQTLFPVKGEEPWSSAGTSNTRPARGFNAAPKHLFRSRKYRSLEEKWLFFQFFLWNYNLLRFLFNIPSVSIQNFKKTLQTELLCGPWINFTV